jgi:hypothetical protein
MTSSCLAMRNKKTSLVTCHKFTRKKSIEMLSHLSQLRIHLNEYYSWLVIGVL